MIHSQPPHRRDRQLPAPTTHRRSRAARRPGKVAGRRRLRPVCERLEEFVLLSGAPLSAAFQLIGLYQARQDFQGLDGAIPDGTGGTTPLSVVVIDTGVDYTHPDLQSAYQTGKDFYNGTADPMDHLGHGTHVSGIVAARDPNIGVAPAAGLIDLKVFGDDQQHATSPLSDQQDALQWVIDSVKNGNPYHIVAVNMSLGGGWYTDPDDPNLAGDQRQGEIRTLEGLGVTVVVAAGNAYGVALQQNQDGSTTAYDFQYANSAAPGIYATLDVGNVWPVDAGRDPADAPSNYYIPGHVFDNSTGPDHIAASSQRPNTANAIFAPGSNILSTWPGGQLQQDSGTSMASPMVAGVVALLQDAAYTYLGKPLTPDQVRQVLQDTADKIYDTTAVNDTDVVQADGSVARAKLTGQTFDRINVDRAVAAVKAMGQNGGGGGGGSGSDPNGTIATPYEIGVLDGSSIQYSDGSYSDYQFVVAGTIGTDGGTTQVGNKDVDIFHFVPAFDGAVTITTASLGTGSDVDTVLRLFDASGNELDSNDDDPAGGTTYSNLVFDVSAGQDYYVGLSGKGNRQYNPDAAGSGVAGSTGDYVIGFGLKAADYNGLIDSAVQVATLPQSDIGGSIGYDYGKPVGPQDVDLYQVVAPDNGLLHISIDLPESPPLDPYIKVYWKNRDTGQIQFIDAQAGLTEDIRTYRGDILYIGISDIANQDYDPTNLADRTNPYEMGGFYSLNLSFASNDLNGSIDQARTDIPVGTQDQQGGQFTQKGLIGYDGNQSAGLVQEVSNRDVDFVLFSPTQSGILHIEAKGTSITLTQGTQVEDYTGQVTTLPQDQTVPAVNTSLALFDSNGKLLTASQKDSPNPVIEYQVTAGTSYYVGVSGAGDNDYDPNTPGSGSPGATGGYVFAAWMLNQAQSQTILDADTVRTGGGGGSVSPPSIAVGQSINENIGLDGSYVRGATDYDPFLFQPTTSGWVDIRSVPVGEFGANTYLRLFDAQGNEIASNDDATPTTRGSEVVASVTAGNTYYIGVSGKGNQTYTIGGQGTASGAEGNYTLTISPANPESIAFAAAGYAVKEDAGSVSVVVTRSGGTDGTASVHFATAAGSAAAGVNFTPVAGTLSFAAGETSKTISIPIHDDGQVLSDLSFTVSLSSPTGGATLGGLTSATIVVHNVDVPVDNGGGSGGGGSTGGGGSSNGGGSNNGGPAVATLSGASIVKAKKGQSAIVLNFNGAASSPNLPLSAFRLTTLPKGKHKRVKTIRLKGVVADPANHTITITPQGKLKLGKPLELTIIGLAGGPTELILSKQGAHIAAVASGRVGASTAAVRRGDGRAAAGVGTAGPMARLVDAVLGSLTDGDSDHSTDHDSNRPGARRRRDSVRI